MGSSLPFTKMHGCSNDFVVVDAVRGAVPEPGPLARRLSDRRTGVGSDGLLLALPSERAAFRMRMFNVDGTEAEMCGNGLRCLVKFVLERGLVPAAPRGTVETAAGVLAYEAEVCRSGRGVRVGAVTLEMGVPRLERAEVPMRGSGRAVDAPLGLGTGRVAVTAVSLGNPHAVLWVADLDAVPLDVLGPQVERHPDFPGRTNVEVAELTSRREVRQRTWERGCGETLACGTGACAVVVAGVLTGRTDRAVRVRLRGGDLQVHWREEDGQVLLRGPAETVFEGRFPLD